MEDGGMDVKKWKIMGLDSPILSSRNS